MVHMLQLKEWKKQNNSSGRRIQPFTLFTSFMKESSNKSLSSDQLKKLWYEADDEVRKK